MHLNNNEPPNEDKEDLPTIYNPSNAAQNISSDRLRLANIQTNAPLKRGTTTITTKGTMQQELQRERRLTGDEQGPGGLA